MHEDSKSLLLHVADLAVSLDVHKVRANVRNLRARYPHATRRELAAKCIQRARIKAMATGFGTGLSSSPWTSLPAALADVGIMFRIEVVLAAHVALLFDDSFFDDDGAVHELILPIMGARFVGELTREAAMRGGMGITRIALQHWFTQVGFSRLRHLLAKYLGLKVAEKSIISKTLPVVGSAIGAGWNFFECGLIGNRLVAYFEGQSIFLPAEPLAD